MSTAGMYRSSFRTRSHLSTPCTRSPTTWRVRSGSIDKSARRDVEAEVMRLLARVQLPATRQFAAKLPQQLSGGQRQRVAIARALAARPSVLLADEPVSMLDVSIRLSVLNLLADLVHDGGLALLYITHDIASARYFADTICVMYAGRIRREWTGGRSRKQSGTSVHRTARLGGSGSRRPTPERRNAYRRAPEPDRTAFRVSIPHTMPLRLATLQRRFAPELQRR